MKLSNYYVHFGEEKVISGENGSGLIFFTGCNMRCCFCKDYRFSILNQGTEISIVQLSDIMLEFQRKGCHNINLCNVTTYVDEIINAIELSKSKGLILPIIYNSNGYDKINFLDKWSLYFDIYLVDMKYSDDKLAFKYSGVKNYVDTVINAIKYMQVKFGKNTSINGVLFKGIIIRHLILPNNEKNLAGVKDIVNKNFTDLVINYMPQFIPEFESYKFDEL
jgi:putative pyruvate formate lyase activating enzyme